MRNDIAALNRTIMNDKQAKSKAQDYCRKLRDKEEVFLLSIDCNERVEKHDPIEIGERGFWYFVKDYECWLFTCNLISKSYEIACVKRPKEEVSTW